MIFDLFSPSAGATILVIILPVLIFAMRRLRSEPQVDLTNHSSSEAAVKLSKLLLSALPGDVFLPKDEAFFRQSMNVYWDKQERDVIPACVVRPQNIKQLSTAVTILKNEYDQRQTQQKESQNGKKQGDTKTSGLFAVRSGGHSPVSLAASIHDGVLIDMSLFNEVTLSHDRSSVVIGVGARWGDVFETLAAKGLAVAGGRNSHVGVGGLTLGGGISFFSPQYGFVSSTVLSYEIVLASGSIVTASATSNCDLWRALKGGSNNYGIVTRITVTTFASSDIWSGFLHIPSSSATKVLSAFHESVNRASHDINAAGPITCFTYIHQLRIEAISVNLVHTKPLENKKWPKCWSYFKSLWAFWNTCKIRTLKNACDELDEVSIKNKRQIFGTTTIKNDPATLKAVYDSYKEAITSIKKANIKGMFWILFIQPMPPVYGYHGSEKNIFGLDTSETLVNVTFTVSWAEQRHDQISEKLTREAIEKIDSFATKNGTSHRYRYLNGCGEWQRPFESYGEENLMFMQRVSREYDPDGLFQNGCVGGFKLNMPESEVEVN